jgi:hypothetical protein
VEKKMADNVVTEVQSQSTNLARKGREELIKELNAKARIVTNPSML